MENGDKRAAKVKIKRRTSCRSQPDVAAGRRCRRNRGEADEEWWKEGRKEEGRVSDVHFVMMKIFPTDSSRVSETVFFPQIKATFL